VLCRELTKTYEEFIRGTAAELVALVNEEELKGECCILIGTKNPDEVTTDLAGALEENTPDASLSIAEQFEWFMEHQNLTQKDAIKAVAKHLGLKKQEVYKEIHA
ncbi:MAG: 16S rRNA (cytidine(1402)-2'-O)-methyltransferase, partial [Candidatus Granulicatella sp. P6S_S16_bin.50.1]|nr:16S rRNA (cytidine(1402)-2'-O)-methyltransferase [Candidatus Granulicatella sp. P6S_S16_bin.50.1]